MGKYHFVEIFLNELGFGLFHSRLKMEKNSAINNVHTIGYIVPQRFSEIFSSLCAGPFYAHTIFFQKTR